MTSNVPRLTLSPAGATAPAEADIVAGLWADFQSAFGGNINESLSSPQGQLVSSLAALQGANNDLLLQFFNQVDPAFAAGRMQDAIARIYYLTRAGALPTIVDCICAGANGAVIPAGSLAIATDGTIYQSLAIATIVSGGAVGVQFGAITPGPNPCPAGTLNSIYRVSPGWDSIINAADGIVGRAVETRADFEARRAASVAQNADGILSAVRGAVLNVSGVVDAYVYENPTGSSVTVGGQAIAARTIYVAASGGTDADVARAIWARKSPGCGYTGSTTVAVLDSGSGYSLPYPSYSVKFQRPTALPIYIAVTLANNGQVPANATLLVQNAIIAAFNGEDGGQRARIGSTLYALRYATALASLGTWAQVISIGIGASASPASTSITAQINQIPTIDPAHITLTLA